MTITVDEVIKAVAALLVVAVIILFILPAIGFNINIFLPIQIQLGTPGEYQFSQNEIIPLGDEIVKEHIVSDSTNPEYYVDEVSCFIANDIFEDFVRFGDNGDRGDFHNDINDYIIGVGQVAFDSAKVPVTQANADEMSAYSCRIVQYDGNRQPSYFDELFINYQLSFRKINALDFCKDGFPDPKAQEFREIRFGNNVCFANSANGNRWDDFCDRSGTDDFCNNNRDWIHTWFADDATYRSDSYKDWVVSDRPLKLTSPLFYGGTDSKFQYLYGVIWNPNPPGDGGDWDRKGYEIWLVRVPTRVSRTSNFDFLVDLFRSNTVIDSNCVNDPDCKSYPYVRLNNLGFFYPEARKVVDVNVTLTESISPIDLAKRIHDASADSALDYETSHIYGPGECEGETDCAGPDPNQPRRPSSGPEPRGKSYNGYGIDGAGCNNYEYEIQNRFATIEPIAFRTNVNPNVDFKAGKTYRVVVYLWFGKFTVPNRYWITGGDYDPCYGWFEKTIGIYEYPQTT